MKLCGYFYCGIATTINVVIYALSIGRFLWLEGRVTGGVFRNWARRFAHRPDFVHFPATEDELREVVRLSEKLRVVGSGHSFNSGVVSNEALLSLDRYNAVIAFDQDARTLTVQAGMRVRDISKALLRRGLAFEALPSHDAQSIGGILSTDVHGTGRDWGFVSESVVSMKVIDGKGEVHYCETDGDLARAAIGGIGAVGIISEVTIKAVDRFNIRQSFEISTISDVEEKFDALHDGNEHFGLFLFPFTEKCQLNTWNSTSDPKSCLSAFREFVAISMDALLASLVGNLLAYTKLLPRLSGIAHSVKRGSNLVLESNEAHNRSIYHLHQELEVAIDYTKVFTVCREILAAYEELYEQGLPYPIIEVRFTPEGHDRALISPGSKRRSAWIDIICCDSPGYEVFYERAEAIFKSAGGRPHLGKYCRSYGRDDLLSAYGKDFQLFLKLVGEHDPNGKFSNKFTRRMFGV